MDEREYQDGMEFLRNQCPAFQEHEERLRQLITCRIQAVTSAAHVMCHAADVSTKTAQYDSIVGMTRQLVEEVCDGKSLQAVPR